MINFDSLKKGDWIEVKNMDGETLSLILFLKRDLDDFFFHTFYFGHQNRRLSRFHLNDKWFMYEIQDYKVISHDEVKKYFGFMFETIFEGRISDENK